MIHFQRSMFSKLYQFFQSPVCVLSLGSLGAFGLVVRGNQITDTFFVPTPSELEQIPFLVNNPFTPIKLLFDFNDILFEEHKVPPLKKRDLENFVQNKLNEQRETDLKASMLNLDVDSTANPVTACLARTGTSDQWIKALSNLPNPILSAGFLPLESCSLAGKLCAKKSKFALLVTVQSTGGVRHIISQGSSFVATRLTDIKPNAKITEVMQHLEKEVYNTLSHLRKISSQDPKNVTLIFVVQPSLKSLLNKQNFPVQSTVAYTFEEVCWQLNVEPEKSISADACHLLNYAKDSSVSTFLPKEFYKRNILFRTKKILRVMAFSCFAIGAFLMGGMEFLSNILEKKIDSHKDSIAVLRLEQEKQKGLLAVNSPVAAHLMKSANDQVEALKETELLEFTSRLRGCLDERVTLKRLEWKRLDTGETKCVMSFYFHQIGKKEEIVQAFKDTKQKIKKTFVSAEVSVQKAPFGTHKKSKSSAHPGVEAELGILLPINWKDPVQ